VDHAKLEGAPVVRSEEGATDMLAWDGWPQKTMAHGATVPEIWI